MSRPSPDEHIKGREAGRKLNPIASGSSSDHPPRWDDQHAFPARPQATYAWRHPQGYVEEREELRTTLEGMFVIQLL